MEQHRKMRDMFELQIRFEIETRMKVRLVLDRVVLPGPPARYETAVYGTVFVDQLHGISGRKPVG